MIERYTLTSLDEVADTFGVTPPPGPPRFNIAPVACRPGIDLGELDRARRRSLHRAAGNPAQGELF